TAELEFSRAQRYQTELSCVLLDLDHFKSINDRHGHLVGDQVLVAVAERLKHELRQSDLAARYGGEEFAVLLAQTGSEGARMVAERQRLRIANLRVACHNAEVRPTASFGIATFPKNRAGTLQDLLRQADEALYRAKARGRNCVELAIE
ncbi:GGDEF domain-containing protein, partial [Myxococcota bacterium]